MPVALLSSENCLITYVKVAQVATMGCLYFSYEKERKINCEKGVKFAGVMPNWFLFKNVGQPE